MQATNKHILVVDDNEEMLEILTTILSKQGFAVSPHTRTHNFLELIKKTQPDIILLDMRLCWANGCDLCKDLKKNNELQRIPIVMFSAYHKAKENCMLAGADAFIAKPFDLMELVETLNTKLDLQKNTE